MRSVVTALVAALIVMTLGGCAGSAGQEPGRASTAVVAPSPAPSRSAELNVSLVGGGVYPLGERLTVERGEVLMVGVLADIPGELHVHSKPEQHIAFEAGSTTHELTFDVPGVVEIEDHASDTVIAQITVK